MKQWNTGINRALFAHVGNVSGESAAQEKAGDQAADASQLSVRHGEQSVLPASPAAG